ncbi:MAG TPA: hypothetical protein VGX46_19620 [Vicinamibacterales bacterium]|jgi:hypothetical protein|nr:hypothetical protein [Vicinamibacterales bacterium]
MHAALLVIALAFADQPTSPHPREQADEQVERVRAALEKPSSKLTMPEVKPDFKVHIEERRPLQEIFDTPPWQLAPIGWRPPAVGFDLMSLLTKGAKGVTEAKRGHDLHVARDEVQRAVAEYCAAQPNAGEIQMCWSSPAIR